MSFRATRPDVGMWVAIWWMISVGRAVTVVVAIAVWEKGVPVAVCGSMSSISESIISDESSSFDEVGGKCSTSFQKNVS